MEYGELDPDFDMKLIEASITFKLALKSSAGMSTEPVYDDIEFHVSCPNDRLNDCVQMTLVQMSIIQMMSSRFLTSCTNHKNTIFQ
uniref:Uncharacterized protein n=1 Tax=Megaselia scalaris TaxID=36166 RepID=T1GZS4_MEGSC